MASVSSVRTLLLQHCKRGGKLKQFRGIQSFLEEEIKTKKSEQVKKRLVTSSDIAEFYMDKIIRYHSAIIDYEYNNVLDDLVYNDTKSSTKNPTGEPMFNPDNNWETAVRINHIYVGDSTVLTGDYKRMHDEAMSFDPEDWTLSNESKELTDEDIEILDRFKANILEFMDECIAAPRLWKEGKKKLVKARNLYEKQTREDAMERFVSAKKRKLHL